MLTQEQVLKAIEDNTREPRSLDSRELSRLALFVPISGWPRLAPPREWTESEVLKQLADDVEFGFEKALNRRGISASIMFEVVLMWMWVLEDPLQHRESDYAQYGLPLFKAVAAKYGFPNPIGDDTGSEHKYSTEGER